MLKHKDLKKLVLRCAYAWSYCFICPVIDEEGVLELERLFSDDEHLAVLAVDLGSVPGTQIVA